MVEVREYLDRGGHSPFAAWSDRLNREAAAKVAAADKTVTVEGEIDAGVVAALELVPIPK